ncbi:MBL fold metallo-hydrolase [Candidatus Gracilibacteria bacterium]|nr:MBL fold metallo-hydrolase [Candidatus Gracilibacteria bacterium]MCF7856100.1 MBL fold metallo-hydrolase [Candidatus Gracilibacteria bacterium]MCF7896519.1 MBL fold metallo-hydrolase [Candidatus Gracilibacteria bacterium]
MPKRFLFRLYGILGICGTVLIFGFWSLPSHDLETTFLDVGQGDAILIRTPQQQKILIDAGQPGQILPPLAEELSFWERKIQLAILTHPDTDHIAGFLEILKRYEVENILLTGVQHETQWYDEILKEIARQQIPVLIADAEQDFKFGEVFFDIFWPDENLLGASLTDANAGSIALKMTFGKTTAILTGDLDLESEEKILKNAPNLTAQVLKISHHGSRTASSAKFLAAVNPDFAIISAGEGNSFGHPHEEVLARLENSKILETAKIGSIKLVSDGEKWRTEN